MLFLLSGIKVPKYLVELQQRTKKWNKLGVGADVHFLVVGTRFFFFMFLEPGPHHMVHIVYTIDGVHSSINIILLY